MKISPIVFSLAFAFTLWPATCQTVEIEKDNLMQKYLAGEMTQLEFRDVAVSWRELTDAVEYPVSPYDSIHNKVVYTYFHTLDGIPRGIIVNRVSEWAAVTFGNTGGLLTRQEDAVRFIINGSIEVFFPDLFLVWKNGWTGYAETELLNSSICVFTMVFTIRESRLKCQIMNIKYEYTDYLNNLSVNKTLDSCFPITSNEQDEWKAIMNLVNETRKGMEVMNDQLVSYIQNYDHDYDW